MKKKKTSWISFIMPYVIIIGIIVVISLVFSQGSSNRASFSEGEIITTRIGSDSDSEWKTKVERSVLWTKDFTKISVTYYSDFIDISGSYKGQITSSTGTTKNVIYSFSSRISGTDDNKDFLAYVFENRLDSEGKHYFTSSNYAIVNPNASNFWTDYFPMILLVVVGLGLVLFLVSRMGAAASKSNNQAMDFNKSRARREDNTPVRFSDVAGCEEEKEEMMELVDYLKHPDKYAKAGAKLPKGLLLVGPPGTGKTLLAKAVAGEARVPFYSISGSDFVEMFVGVGAGRVRDMFRKAKQTAPCLIFIDEIDAVGRQRGAGLGGGNDEREQTLNQLLVEMDGFADNVGIIVIAATNRSDILDPALLRAGRFDRQITVGLPDKKGREEILKVHSRNKKFDDTVDWENVARRTIGMSGADLANVVNEAAILAVRAKKDTISIVEVDEAIDRRIAGPAKKSKRLTEKERKTVAYHEAGHAIIGLKLECSDKVQKVTIVPRGMAGGYVLSAPENDRFLMSKDELSARIVGFLGGRSSEEVFFNEISTGASNDIEQATEIARAMVVEYGMSSLGPIQYEKNTGSVFLGRDYTSNQKNFSGNVANEIDKEVRKIIEDAHEKAVNLIKENKDDVILIAETLLEFETLNSEEIDYLLKNRKMPDYALQPKKDSSKQEDKQEEQINAFVKNAYNDEEKKDDKEGE